VQDIYVALQQKGHKPRTWAQGMKLRKDTKQQRGFRAGGAAAGP